MQPTTAILRFFTALIASGCFLSETRSQTVAHPDFFSTAANTPLIFAATNVLRNDTPGAANGTNTQLSLAVFFSPSSRGGSVSFPPTGQPLWTNRYNGPGNNADFATAVAIDDLGNAYVGGNSFDESGYAIIKYSPSGAPAWTNHYGPGLRDVVIAADGESIYVGGSALIKYRPDGRAEWTNSSFSITRLVARNGDVYALASGVLVKFSPAGGVVWSKVFGGANALAVGSTGDVYVAGFSGTGAARDFRTTKYLTDGTAVWTSSYNGPENNEDQATAIAVDATASVYVTGWSTAAGGFPNEDYATIKYFADGSAAWTNRYNGPANSLDEPRAIAVDLEGNVFVTGQSAQSTSLGLNIDFATIKYLANGLPDWTNRYAGNSSFGGDAAVALAVDNSGNAYVTGYSGFTVNADFATIKYSSAGAALWIRRYDSGMDELATAFALDRNGNVIVTGTRGEGILSDFVTIKYASGAEATYTPPTGFIGTDTFSYVIRDSISQRATGIVSVAVGPAVTRPALFIRPGGGTAIIEWPTNFADYALQSTPAITDTNAWTTITNVGSVSGTNYSVTVPTLGDYRFFRLRSR